MLGELGWFWERGFEWFVYYEFNVLLVLDKVFICVSFYFGVVEFGGWIYCGVVGRDVNVMVNIVFGNGFNNLFCVFDVYIF